MMHSASPKVRESRDRGQGRDGGTPGPESGWLTLAVRPRAERERASPLVRADQEAERLEAKGATGQCAATSSLLYMRW